MKEYYIIYGWIDEYTDNGQCYMHPVPWCVTEDKQKAVRYFSCNTDESLCLVIVKVKLNSECLDLNKVSEELEAYANEWQGNKLSWTSEQWESFITDYSDDKEPEIFELNLD